MKHIETKTIIKAINMANYDNIKTVEVDIEDLLLLKDVIESLQKQNNILKNDVNIANAKLALRVFDTPISLRAYA